MNVCDSKTAGARNKHGSVQVSYVSRTHARDFLDWRASVGALSNGSISLTVVINLLLFIGLNVGDAWLTSQVLDAGWQELNPIVRLYNGNMVAKAFGSLAAALVLVRFGKANLLWILNIAMLALVLWLSAGLYYFL